MWLLGRVLPYEIGRYIPKKDKHWQNYLLLLKVCYSAHCTYYEYKVQLVCIM